MIEQGSVTKGLYEFEDPSGCLLAAKVPQTGTAALFSGTRILVKPNQSALFIYNGKITDALEPGNNVVQTGNYPVLTKLASWQFGFESPLRCEIWFFARNIFAARRWGTASPVLLNLPSLGTIAVRAYGNYSIEISDPATFYLKQVGTRARYDITELEEFVQGQVLEQLPLALKPIKEARELNAKQDEVSERLEELVNKKLAQFGLKVVSIQVLSLLPAKEVLQALDEKVAMEIIGDQKQYLLYKMANSLDQVKAGGSDPAQLMMSLMLSKSLETSDYKALESKKAVELPGTIACPGCKAPIAQDSSYCSKCGRKLGP